MNDIEQRARELLEEAMGCAVEQNLSRQVSMASAIHAIIAALSQQAVPEDAIRAEFEAWAFSRAMPIDCHPVMPDKYFSNLTEAAWDGWRAALATHPQPAAAKVGA